MPPFLPSFLRQRVWSLTAGVALACGALLLLGREALWVLLGLAIAVSILAGFVSPRKLLGVQPEPRADDTLATLPSVTRLLLEQLPMPVMLLDESERVLFVNEWMRELLGPGLERKHVSAVLRNPDVLTAIDDAMQGRQANVPFTLPVPIERHFQAYAARIHVAPPVTALLLHDLTAIKRSEQMREDFIANVSHELRTPLAAVSGFIDTLRGHAKDDAAAREQFLDIMMVEAARMRRLIDDLLSLTRIEMNEHVPPEGRIQLDNVVREVAAALMPLARADNIAIEIAGSPDQSPPVLGDRDELVQLFQNLIHNAIKYSRDNGHVWISSGQTADGQVFVTVRDDGEGIPPSAVPRLTERFYRVDIKRSREKGGTGLGLAIVKHIVNRHGGRLQIESRLGEGSSFTVLMPPATAEKRQKAAISATALGVTEML
jgi:two-component system, OmpR family, phosphate regulon sensor histidine kinase PhoR